MAVRDVGPNGLTQRTRVLADVWVDSQDNLVDESGRIIVGSANGQLKRDYYAAVISSGEDDTAELQAALDAAPDNSRVIFPRATWRFTNLATTKSLLIDWSGSTLIVDPTPGALTTGNPAMWIRGTLGTDRAFGNLTRRQSTVTLTTPAQASNFPAGQMVRIKDSKRVYNWADLDSSGTADPTSSDAAGAVGYQDRWETNFVLSSDAGTGVIVLARPTEWAYDATPVIAPITPVVGAGVVNIASITEVDPGGVFNGPDVQTGPNLIKIDLARDPYVADITASAFNLMAVSLDTCDGGIVERVVALNPLRANNGGHGYLGRANRCTNTLFRQCAGLGVRHVVDTCQAYSSGSENCISHHSSNTAFAFHGLGERRCFSRFDKAFQPDSGANNGYGWAVGNPSFAASFDTEITEPEFVGAGTAIVVGYLSDNTTIKAPRLKGVVPAGSSKSFRGVMHVTGATRTRILGGYIDASEVFVIGAECVTARNNVVLADTIAVKPDSLKIDGVEITPGFGDAATSMIGVRISQCTSTEIINNTFVGILNSQQSIGILYDATNNVLIVRGNHFRGSNFKYGLQTTVAPTQTYIVQGNSSNAAYSIAYMQFATSALLREEGNAHDETVALTDAATITPDFAMNAAGGRPSRKAAFTVTLGGNRTLGNPATLTGSAPVLQAVRDGQIVTMRITQDATGNRTLTYASKWKIPAGFALSTAANAVDVLVWRYDLALDVFHLIDNAKGLA